uniref:Uncharacterized protein n=1 Tax=Romanomermis culicivorax TaxID=13658 RepID=A0A915KUR1_ROMCU
MVNDLRGPKNAARRNPPQPAKEHIQQNETEPVQGRKHNGVKATNYACEGLDHFVTESGFLSWKL